MSSPGILEELTDKLKGFVSTSYEIKKLEAIKRSSVIGASLVSRFIIVLIAFMFLFFFSLWVGLFLSAIQGDTYSGFTYVAGFYFIVSIIFIIGRKSLLQKPIRDRIIQKTFNGNLE